MKRKQEWYSFYTVYIYIQGADYAGAVDMVLLHKIYYYSPMDNGINGMETEPRK